MRKLFFVPYNNYNNEKLTLWPQKYRINHGSIKVVNIPSSIRIYFTQNVSIAGHRTPDNLQSLTH